MEELRSKHKSLQSAAHHIALECIHPQAAHGSPYHVHPYPSPVRLQHAFQNPQHSPKMFHPKGLKPHLDPRAYGTPNDSPILGRALCLTPRGSPIPGRVSHLNEKFQDSLTLTADTDALVAKISAMFPTVSETHIKILLKKYYNREAVVISALQVEKHPITTPGPLTMSPSAVRLQKGAPGLHSALQLAKGMSGSVPGSSHYTPMTGTPHGSPSLLRPASGASSYFGARSDGQPPRHHSPKMKLKTLLRIDREPEILKTLQCCVSGTSDKEFPEQAYIKRDDADVEDRYLKSIFPKAEETLILDVLANKENNVQKASEELIGMGFTKKETIVAKKKDKEKEATPLPQKKVVTIMKTTAEKNALKEKLQKKYSDIAERVITLALESVDFNEDRAEKMLIGVQKEESTPKVVKVVVKETQRPSTAEPKKGVEAARQPSPAPAPPASRRIKTWTEHLKPILKSSSRAEPKFKSQYSSPTNGPNASLRQGHKDSLLLPDYTPWQGPDPELRSAQPVKAEGPHPRERPAPTARGPTGLAKGPSGLAKGSLYQKLSKKSAKIIG